MEDADEEFTIEEGCALTLAGTGLLNTLLTLITSAFTSTSPVLFIEAEGLELGRVEGFGIVTWLLWGWVGVGEGVDVGTGLLRLFEVDTGSGGCSAFLLG